ncbi:MAG: GTP 3',8-cyclase MoaA [Gammaproteobacteria bacterium]|nr:GTP 3',8-cyclase MoaA [Gammaproteobacteria bacterium]
MTRTLSDPFGRTIEYVRLSVTDKCDLRCFYCLPKGFNDFEEPEHWLSFDEIERVMRAFGELGVHRVRITGGEPLVRKDMPLLAARLARLPGIDDLLLSTNAVQLAKHARALKDAGVTRLNVSLDSLRPQRFQEITGGKLEKVLAGLQAAKAAGFHPVKINMVVMKGVRIGFITPISQHFCATCNRVRLSVDGTLYMCLGQEHNFELRPLLRAGISDAELRTAIVKAIALKPERHEFSGKPEKILRFMSKTGG